MQNTGMRTYRFWNLQTGSVLLPQKGQLGMAGKLLASTTVQLFEVFTVEDDGFELLSGRERLHVVEWEKRTWNPANVLGTEMFEHAKK